jgi:hypothetical protein
LPYGFGYCERNSEESFPLDDGREQEPIADDARVISLTGVATRYDFGCLLWERDTQRAADHWRVPWDEERTDA